MNKSKHPKKPVDPAEGSEPRPYPIVSRDEIEYGVAEPQIQPTPTYWPFVTAVGLAFLLWWIVASWIVGVVGFCLFVVGLYGWIKELRNEENQEA